MFSRLLALETTSPFFLDTLYKYIFIYLQQQKNGGGWSPWLPIPISPSTTPTQHKKIGCTVPKRNKGKSFEEVAKIWQRFQIIKFSRNTWLVI